MMVNRFGGGTPIGLLAEKPIGFGEVNIVQRYLKNELNKYHPNYKDNIKRNFSAFFNFCFKQRYIEANENPCLRIDFKRKPKDPAVLALVEAFLNLFCWAFFCLHLFGLMRFLMHQKATSLCIELEPMAQRTRSNPRLKTHAKFSSCA